MSDAPETYMDHIVAAASEAAYTRHEENNARISAETVAENSSLIDFKSFAQEYPDRLWPLLAQLRPEFQEFFIEYYILEKSQSFIGQTHGCIQTRIWQNLRIIEQTIGSLILLGTNPGVETLRAILIQAGLDQTEFGSLAHMIVLYAQSQNYGFVAKTVHAPKPAIRKIFRPIITTLLAAKDVKQVAVGAYLRSLTHQSSLTQAGLSKRCLARHRRVKIQKFVAPPIDNSPLISFGQVSALGDTPWNMLEISSEHRMEQIGTALRTKGKKIFGKKPAQIFAPVNTDGELSFGYIFARCISSALVRSLTHIRGIAEISAIRNDEGDLIKVIEIPHTEVKQMMGDQFQTDFGATLTEFYVGDFVEVLTGPAARYCGTIMKVDVEKDVITVQIQFPTGRGFLVTADSTSIKYLGKPTPEKRNFWGMRLG